MSHACPASSFFVCSRTPCDPSPVLSLPARLPVALPTPRRSPRRGKSTRGGRGKMAAWALGMSWTRCDQVGRKQTRERGLRGFSLSQGSPLNTSPFFPPSLHSFRSREGPGPLPRQGDFCGLRSYLCVVGGRSYFLLGQVRVYWSWPSAGGRRRFFPPPFPASSLPFRFLLSPPLAGTASMRKNNAGMVIE